MQRYTKIMFGASYLEGSPRASTRIDPNNPVVQSGNQKWPNREQPFRSQPRALALTPNGGKLYVSLAVGKAIRIRASPSLIPEVGGC
jgi:hypothetical protein